jgi:hypothetical protein
MSNYSKVTNWTAKDTLPSGDPDKVISGAEFDTEFSAIQTAINSKTDQTAIYPVGALFLSTSSTSPATSLGFGTWGSLTGGFIVDESTPSIYIWKRTA